MTRFLPVQESPGAVEWLLKESRESLILVSRHGLGDNVFFSPCFEPLGRGFGKLFFCSSVNAYTSIFHESGLVTPVYSGGVNGGSLGLRDGQAFVNHFDRLGLDLGVGECFVYHFGLFEPPLPYSDPRAFVKGRRYLVEMNLPIPPPTEVPRYRIAPDPAGKTLVDTVLGRWLPDRALVVIARYGHTDLGKNFGHDQAHALAAIDAVDRVFPGRFKYLCLDYMPGGHAAGGHRLNVRSTYGFLPCDAGALFHILARARLLVTVPTGPMLVGATIPGLQMLTLWKEAKPWHYLDPQDDRKVWALVERPDCRDAGFMAGWNDEDRAAVLGRWHVVHAPVDPESVALCMIRMLKGE